jgi:hypothetical protein
MAITAPAATVASPLNGIGTHTPNRRLQTSRTPLLDRVKIPDDLRRLPETSLPELAAELRQETIDAVSVTGGHLGAGLGVIELTVALHYLFDTPRDRVIWDAIASARYARGADSPVSPSGRRASTTRSAPRILPPRSRRAWAWR